MTEKSLASVFEKSGRVETSPRPPQLFAPISQEIEFVQGDQTGRNFSREKFAQNSP
jgi:hypothetical protein